MVRKYAALGEGARNVRKKDKFDLDGITNKLFKDLFKFGDSREAYIQVRKDTIAGIWFSYTQAVKYESHNSTGKVFEEALEKICDNSTFLEDLQDYLKKFGQECFILYCGVIQENFSIEYIDGKSDYSLLKDPKQKEKIKKKLKGLYDSNKAAVAYHYVPTIFGFILKFWKATDVSRGENFRYNQSRQDSANGVDRDDVNGADRAIYHSFFQFSRMGEFKVDGCKVFCMHATTRDPQQKSGVKNQPEDAVKFCLYAEEETPGEGVRKDMLTVSRRISSDQGDSNLCETYENRNEDSGEDTVRV